MSMLQYYMQRHGSRNPLSVKTSFLDHQLCTAKQLFSADLKGHFGCVNAVEFLNKNYSFIISGGDDRRVLIWNVHESLSGCSKPSQLKTQHLSNIFCVGTDSDDLIAFSGGNDEQVIVHDLITREQLISFDHTSAVYDLSVHPVDSHIFVSAADDGKNRIFDTRSHSHQHSLILSNYQNAMHSVCFNSFDPVYVASANAVDGVGLWDVRHPGSCVLRYGGSLSQQSAMCARFNQLGDRIVALRRKLPPVVYSIHEPLPYAQFDNRGYYNGCTMKSCCFAGSNDQYILAGSDDFNIYMWKIPDSTGQMDFAWISQCHLILKGHRSVANHVRSNRLDHTIISSGVEKIIKVWSPLPLTPGNMPSDDGEEEIVVDELETQARDSERPVYTHEEYITMMLTNGAPMHHDYADQSVEESPQMLAFFDSLVQRELQSGSSDENGSDDDEFMHNFIEHYRASVGDSDSESSSGDSDNADVRVSLLLADVMSSQADERGDVNIFRMVSRADAPADSAENTNHTLLPGQLTISSRPKLSEMIYKKRKDYLTEAANSCEQIDERIKQNRAERIRKRLRSRFKRRSNLGLSCSPEISESAVTQPGNEGTTTSSSSSASISNTSSRRETYKQESGSSSRLTEALAVREGSAEVKKARLLKRRLVEEDRDELRNLFSTEATSSSTTTCTTIYSTSVSLNDDNAGHAVNNSLISSVSNGSTCNTSSSLAREHTKQLGSFLGLLNDESDETDEALVSSDNTSNRPPPPLDLRINAAPPVTDTFSSYTNSVCTCNRGVLEQEPLISTNNVAHSMNGLSTCDSLSSSVSSADSPTPAAATDAQPVWFQFQRFRNRLERLRRFRRHLREHDS